MLSRALGPSLGHGRLLTWPFAGESPSVRKAYDMLVNIHQSVKESTHIKVRKLVVMSGVARRLLYAVMTTLTYPAAHFRSACHYRLYRQKISTMNCIQFLQLEQTYKTESGSVIVSQ